LSEHIQHIKTLRQRDMVLFTVAAILLPDTLASVASMGSSSLSWWIILAVFFLLPFGLISAELGCAYPEQGGIYAWVRDAFGGRWASRITWCYWINMGLWLPAIYIFCASIFNQVFALQSSLQFQIGLAIALTWLTVGTNIVALRIGKWIPNIGALVKMLLFGGIIFGAWRYTSINSMANPMTLEALTPNWGEGLQFIPAIVYGMLGFELVSAGAAEMRNPARDVPRAILYSGIIVVVLCLLGTAAVLAAIPAQDINLVEGLIDTLHLFFGDLALGGPLVTGLGLATLFAIFSGGVTWALGVNRAAAEAALEGELPRWFGIETRHNGTPLGAAMLTGCVSTTALLLYGFMAGSNEDLFWALFAFSGVLFLLPYVGMALAFLQLRRADRDHHRPFLLPGGNPGAVLAAMLCAATLLIAITLFMYTPGSGPEWTVITGVISMLALGELVIRIAEREAAGNRIVSKASESVEAT
jgi:amino acid transporter